MRVPDDYCCLNAVALPERPVAAILNSRQSKRPSLADDWVKNTVAAVKYLVDRGYVISTSVDMNTWELLVHLVNVCGGSQLLVISGDLDKTVTQRADEIARDFRLEPARVGFMIPDHPPSADNRRKSTWERRDEFIIEFANILVPVSIRPGGNLCNRISAASVAGKDLNSSFCVEHRPGVDKVSYSLTQGDLNRDLADMHWPYLTHWTRSSHLPFPGETRFDYYRDILSSSRYPRSASDTLRRIVAERKIRASSRFIRGGGEVVSFTALHPGSAVGLMRWRRRYVYYNFEPYGIAISVRAAEQLGIREVIYGKPDLYNTLAEPDKPFFQNSGGSSADWKPEAEWRHLGDLKLTDLPDDEIRLLVYSEEDKLTLERISPYRVFSLTSL